MTKKINSKTLKLLKFYNLINYNLIYNNKAINRYKKEFTQISSEKNENLNKLKKTITDIKNCDLKKQAQNIVFNDGIIRIAHRPTRLAIAIISILF